MGGRDSYRITEEQLANLDNLVCERFCANGHEEENREILSSFVCVGSVARKLIEKALRDGFEDDRSGKCAHYIVKDRCVTDGGSRRLGYMFFSLRCGSLFDSEMAKNWYQDERSKLDALLKKAEDAGDADLKRSVENKIASLNDAKEDWKKDWMNEAEEGLLRVKNSFGGIELVHFCKNDAACERWRSLRPSMGRPPRKMCEVLFWHFIVQQVLEIVKLIGAEVFYLFAADETDEQRLCAYYRGLGFKGSEEVSFKCVKPRYDFTCAFMLQYVSGLSAAYDGYFDEFNRSAYAVDD